MVVTILSPGSGYFQACSVGWPTVVLTRYISPTPRWSCWYVATFFESGDQRTTALALAVHPALSVAYPKSFSPSKVSWLSLLLAMSCSHKLFSRIMTLLLPSGETAPPPRPPRPPPPPRPPLPPRAPPAGAAGAGFGSI